MIRRKKKTFRPVLPQANSGPCSDSLNKSKVKLPKEVSPPLKSVEVSIKTLSNDLIAEKTVQKEIQAPVVIDKPKSITVETKSDSPAVVVEDATTDKEIASKIETPTQNKLDDKNLSNQTTKDKEQASVKEVMTLSPTTQPEKSSHTAVVSYKSNRSITKTKRQIIEEHYGHEPKATRHRNALKKLQSMKLDQDKDGKVWSKSIVRDSLLMSDLIYCNPPANSAKELGIRAVLRKMEEKAQSQETPAVIECSPKEQIPEPERSPSPDNNLIAPQIRLNEDGSIVIDEESLVINSSNTETVVNNSPAIYESNLSFVTQASFRRVGTKRVRWSEKQTKKFYNALKIVGADFGLMSTMFRHRNDKELRKKFHLERKKNSFLVDEALKQQHLSKWTNDMFMPLSSSDDESEKTNQKKSRKRKKKSDNPSSNSPNKIIALPVNPSAV